MLTDALIETPAQHLANAFAEHVVAWARDLGAPSESLALLRRVAWLASMSTSEGHVCLQLQDLVSSYDGASVADLRRILLSSGVAGTCKAPGNLPLVIDEDGRVYLHRYFDYEKRLANRLVAACVDTEDGAHDGNLLGQLFGSPPDSGETDWQRLATALALRRRLTVISGGPGTGKTTTVANLLACLLQANPASRIALAAPTGKAAMRMMEAIRSRASAVPPHLQDLLPAEAFTVHRLLGVLPSGGFRHHAGNLLPLDVLVVDEASMLDASLAACLLGAIPAHARIVLLGDKDQLAAVEAGAVFSELCADPSLSPACIEALSAMTGVNAGFITCPEPVHPGSLEDSVIWLSKSYRFTPDSGIGRLAADIKAGASKQAVEWLRSAAASDVRWIEDEAAQPDARTMQSMQGGYAEYLAVLREIPHDKKAIFSAFERFRILCAVQEGPRGVAEINRAIARHFRRTLNHVLDRDHHSAWYPGRPVMILKNDYTLKLYNGDIGIVLPDESGRLMAWFEQERAGYRAVPIPRLPENETAFAMTVHKSQGSEFDSVLMLLPSRPARVLTRELIYTGITRARKTVVVSGSEKVLETAIDTVTQRRSGLASRLREAKLATRNVALLPTQA